MSGYDYKAIRADALMVAEEHEHNRRKYKHDATAHGTMRVPARLVVELIDHCEYADGERKRLEGELKAARAMVRTHVTPPENKYLNSEYLMKVVEKFGKQTVDSIEWDETNGQPKSFTDRLRKWHDGMVDHGAHRFERVGAVTIAFNENGGEIGRWSHRGLNAAEYDPYALAACKPWVRL